MTNKNFVSGPLVAEDFFIIGSVAMAHKLYDEAVVWLSRAEQMENTSQGNTLRNLCQFEVVPICFISMNKYNRLDRQV